MANSLLKKWCNGFKKLSALIVLVSTLATSTPAFAVVGTPIPDNFSAFDAVQAAEILGVEKELVRFRNLQAGAPEEYENERLGLKALLLRKILLGFVQVRQASNKTDVELSYTHDLLYAEQRKLGNILEGLNLANFTQLSVLYTIAPEQRLRKQFITSSILGEISAGLGMTFSVLSILVGKYYRVSNTSTPRFLENSLDGGPVDASNLPVYVTRFLERSDQGEVKSRKELMFEFWKQNYRVDPANKDTLAGINDKKSRSLGWLDKRIVLLWSLRNQIQKFDKQLLALANSCKEPLETSATGSFPLPKLSTKAAEAAHLLKIDQHIAELANLNNREIKNKRRLELEAILLEQVLIGLLEVRLATDKVDQELNYNYDIALSSLLAKRDALLQKNFEANFIQNGVSVAVAKLLFFKQYPKPANQILLVSGCLGTTFSTLALMMSHGGWRRTSDKPNSLTDFLELDLANHHFSPLMTAFLNTPSDESTTGKSKKEELLYIWKSQNIGGMEHASKKRQHRLGAAPPAKYDTIDVLTKRTELLSSLKINLEFFDKDLLALMQETGFDQSWSNAESFDTDQFVIAGMSVHAAEAARLLHIKHSVAGLYATGKAQDLGRLNDELSLSRRVLQALLDLRVTADRLEFDIVKETEVRDRMVRDRDRGIAFTNNANFFQLGICSITSAGLALCKRKKLAVRSNKLNVYSAYLVTILTAASAIQQPGGFRMSKAPPNMLSQILGLETPPDLKYSPLIWKFLNTESPTHVGKTRREDLIEYWRNEKVLPRNPLNKAAAEKLSANGNSHHWWDETIRLVNKRLTMLYALHATVDLLEKELSELLMAAE